MKAYRFCPLCGAELVARQAGGRERPACTCGFVQWGNPVPAAGVCLLQGGEVLWVRRAEEPNRGMWSLPSGFQEYDEDIRTCACREMLEETGLTIELDELLGVYSAFDDPRSNALLVVYLATQTGGEPVAGDDADELRWFPLDAPPREIAWEPHRRALIDLANLVRGRD